ncbi:MAG: hypothetical protein WBA41_06860 [Rivularia sp. (in: cyanobacteria)]
MNSTTLEKVRVYRMSTPEHECPWGLKTVNLLNEKGIDFEVYSSSRQLNHLLET